MDDDDDDDDGDALWIPSTTLCLRNIFPLLGSEDLQFTRSRCVSVSVYDAASNPPCSQKNTDVWWAREFCIR